MSRRALTAALATVAVAIAAAPAAHGQATWRLEQPDPPEGFEFRTPLGVPGDLQFFENRPNRGLLGIEGNSAIPRGLYLFDGERWRQLAIVCGGPGDSMRIAWAGPTEFWTVSEPSAPRRGSGITLCRFKDGQVVASYGTPEQSADPYRPMNAATCNGPDDCWFGGIGSQDGTGSRRGAFHLHWDGTSLTTVYNPQGRGVSDLEAHASTVFESVLVGRRAEDPQAADLAQPEARPALLHRIRGLSFMNDPFQPSRGEDEPPDGAELLALDSDALTGRGGTDLWAAGGGAASGPSVPPGGVVERGPLLARLSDGTFREQGLLPGGDPFAATDRFSDVAAVPGADQAWVTVQPFAQRRDPRADALVARVDAPAGTVERFSLPASGAGRGSAAKIAFTSPADGWMVTYAGWLFHFTDGTRAPRDDDPAFRELIVTRPNESAEQFIPDTPVVDDNQAFAAPPVEIAPPPVDGEPEPGRRLRALLARFSKAKVRRGPLRIVLRFTLRRRAKVGLVGLRRGKVVARTKTRTLKPGRRRVVLRVSRKRYPTRLKFRTRELTLGRDTGADDDADTVTTTGPTTDANGGETAPGSSPAPSSDPAPSSSTGPTR